MAEHSTKKCPFCGEMIHAEAIKCRFCREFLEDDHGLPVSYHAPPVRSARPEAEPAEVNTSGADPDAAPQNEEVMVVRPSLWAMSRVFFKAVLGIVAACVLIAMPIEQVLVEHAEVSETVLANVKTGTNGFAAAVMVAMAFWVLYRAAAVKRIRYEVCPDRIEFARGIFSQQIDNLDIFRIVDIKLHRSLADCLTGVGSVTLITRDKTDPTFRFEKVKDPKALYDVIKKATLIADRKQGVVHVQ